MVSLRNLEKMLRPYSIGGGASSDYTDFYIYQRGNVKVRVDDYLDIPYKTQLENAAKKLGLIE